VYHGRKYTYQVVQHWIAMNRIVVRQTHPTTEFGEKQHVAQSVLPSSKRSTTSPTADDLRCSGLEVVFFFFALICVCAATHAYYNLQLREKEDGAPSTLYQALLQVTRLGTFQGGGL